MADKDKYRSVTDVDFKSLCTAYYVGYEFKTNEGMTPSAAEKPVYIKLGYLLAFLNNMCLLYETVGKKSDAKGNNVDTVKPYVYIDFHPEYNFCLTAPQHMTVDPYKCFIPLQASNADYLKLFEDTEVEALGTNAFKPSTQNTLSATLNSFKTANAYQGKTMEILINTQYLLDLADQFATSDKESTIALKPFLDKLLEDVNKSTGGFNLFRVAYRDDSNTIIIKDDQWTPNLPTEPTMMDRNNYIANRKYMELQIFGSGSLVRDMEFKTNMNTKMSAMIAISAQSANQSANGVDASPIGTYNTNFDDAFMTVKQNASSGSSHQSPNVKETQEVTNTMQEGARKFNQYVASVYNDGRVAKDQTELAINYYLDRFRTKKAISPITSAAPFIPANLSITMDGISGIVMGNAFGIPENRMPASLRGSDGFSKVGFTVVGLTHTLENNQWLTKVRGQMIKLRDITKVESAVVAADTKAFKFASDQDITPGSVATASGCRTFYPGLPILTTVQTNIFSIKDAASYLKQHYPQVGKAVFAIILAEAGKAGVNSISSAGANNFGGVQTDSGVWGFSNFSGQFCRRDSSGVLRMFAAFNSPQAFLDFMVSRVQAKGFSSSQTPDQCPCTLR